MDVKDYYRILVIEPSASIQEIKQAYRRLAKTFHPDKNPGDAYAAAQFADIKEAYEVLTNPAKKEFYLQQRWYNQSIGKRKTKQAVTPQIVLQQALELDRYISTLDVFRMDKEGLKDFIVNLLPDDTIAKLHSFQEPDIIHQIIALLLRAARPLPHMYIRDVSSRLYLLAGDDAIAKEAVTRFITKETKQYNRERFSLLAIFIITLLICLLIWLAG